MMNVLSEWWETIKDQEAILQTFGRDAAGNVSDGYLVKGQHRTAQNAFAGLHFSLLIL